MRKRNPVPLLAVTLAVFAACAQGGPRNRHFENPVSTRKEAQVTSSGEQGAAAVLEGTAWSLVEIVSMDDRVDVPEDRSRYTLQFGADGSVLVRADCNRGTGSWTSESAGQLRFSKIAATQALCLPGSLHDRYMAQFPWVKSYVLKDGRLFLATMADGSIVELERVPQVP